MLDDQAADLAQYRRGTAVGAPSDLRACVLRKLRRDDGKMSRQTVVGLASAAAGLAAMFTVGMAVGMDRSDSEPTFITPVFQQNAANYLFTVPRSE